MAETTFKRSALAVVAGALASVIEPPVPMPPSAWAAESLRVPDGPRAGEPWDAGLTPYIVEPLDHLGPDSTVNEIAVMKSAQSGFTTLAIAAIGHSIDRDPCRMMIVQPTDAALADFNRDKLGPAIDQSPVLKAKVQTQTSRSGQGSTTYSKRFPGGSLTLAIATSAADLRSKTIKKLFRDEIDQYDDDLDGQGSPIEISDGRLFSFLASGDWRKADISTPTLKGVSKIEKRYEAGDKRRWHVTCPGCQQAFVFEFLPGKTFRFDRAYPHRPHYVAPCCGTVIEPHEKNALVRKGRWIATEPRPGAFPSYHFDTLSSPFVPWDEVAKAFLEAADDPLKLKTFWNLWLGLPFELRGDAPDHVRLMERREDYRRGHIPPMGLILVGAADVQMRGIWVEIVAYGPGRRSWTVEATYLEGDTSDPEAGAFQKLTEWYERDWPDAFGGTRRADAFGVDAGYRQHVVTMWCRGRPNAYALKGVEGWNKPALGTPTPVDIDWRGRKIRKGGTVWPVGTWDLKGIFYADLRKEGKRSGHEVDPTGYCTFGTWLDTFYFKQITSEYLAEETYRGRIRKVWKVIANEENHLLDCRIYNLALASHLGLWNFSAEDWRKLVRERCTSEILGCDLFAGPVIETAASSRDKAQTTLFEESELLKSHTSLRERFRNIGYKK